MKKEENRTRQEPRPTGIKERVTLHGGAVHTGVVSKPPARLGRERIVITGDNGTAQSFPVNAVASVEPLKTEP